MNSSDKTKIGSPAFIVKSIHKRHRREFLKSGTSKLLWLQIVKDKKTLREYASAMDVLSRNWEKEGDGVSRTEWCRRKLTDYIEKRHAKFCKQHADLEIQSLPANRKLKVLDVGSCNGLTKELLDFEILPVDIAPANENVYCLDMTSPVFGEETVISSDRNIEQLARDFNAVSFLYVLTFIPDPLLRVKALMSANKCLALGGLLLIASPDSACQNKHMHLIRDWFSGLEDLGFHKLSYTKEKHFHGLTVGKFKDVELGDEEIVKVAQKFHVLHDKHKLEDLK